MARPRIRDVGISVGDLTPGAKNGITDVVGVQVGHATLTSGEGPLQPGIGPVRTGVTVILPHDDNLFRYKVCAAVHTINGFGKVCGFEQVRELGTVETPIALTNTLNVYLVADALAQYAIRQNPEIGIHTSSVNALVGETNDGYLNDLQGRHVRAEHVWAAIEAASPGPVPEGTVGAGTGTSCFGWKGGIGTASRTVPERGQLYRRSAGAVKLWAPSCLDSVRRSGRSPHSAPGTICAGSQTATAGHGLGRRLNHGCAGDGCTADVTPTVAVMRARCRRSGPHRQRLRPRQRGFCDRFQHCAPGRALANVAHDNPDSVSRRRESDVLAPSCRRGERRGSSA
jgi:hypothetical protein